MRDRALIIREPRPDGMGDQTTLTPAGLKAVRKLAAAGAGKRSLASHLGVAYSTLQRMFERHPELADAWSAGLSDEEKLLVGNLRRAADKGNIVANIFLLKARHGYREGDALEQRPNVTIMLPGASSPDQYAKVIEAEPLPPKPEPKKLVHIIKPVRS